MLSPGSPSPTNDPLTYRHCKKKLDINIMEAWSHTFKMECGVDNIELGVTVGKGETCKLVLITTVT
jgi:hypothetical protein